MIEKNKYKQTTWKHKALSMLLAGCLSFGTLATMPIITYADPIAPETDITADFTDEKFKAYVLEAFDAIRGNGDSLIQAGEVLHVLSLDVSGKDITSLAGIQHFTNLARFDCSNNQLTTLPELPTSLERLFCNGNQLMTLPELPTSLKELSCANNQLTTLPELPTSLERLYCNGNQLTTLDVTGLSNLSFLNCSYNNMADPSKVVGFNGTWDKSNYIFEPQNTTNTVTVPSAPQNLTAIAGDGKVTLTWTAPANDGGSAITGYHVSDGTRNLASGNTNTCTLVTLTNDTPYTFYVYAENSVGPGLEASVTATPTAGGGGNSDGGGGGNSGGGGSGGGGSYTPSTPTITTDKQINQPVMVKQDVASKIDANGNATASITEAMLKTLIDKGKASGNIGEGIGVQLNLDFASKASSVSTQLDAAALDLLISMGVDRLDLNSPLMNFSFDKAAIDEMNKQMTGTVMVSAKPVTKLSDEAQRLIGNRPVFDLTVNDSTGKAVTNFGKGVVTLGFAYKPGADEKVGNLCGVYIPANGQPQILTNSSQDGDRLIFSRSSFSTYGVGYKTTASEFTDTKTHWAKDDIDFVVSRGLVSGTTATDFAPDKAMTRGIFLTALGKLSVADVSGYKTSSFTDVKNTDPAMPYIEWAVKNNIVNGMGNNKFAPDATITREQMAVMMQNYAKVTNYTMPVVHQATVFADDDKISSWAADAVKSMQQSGIISGKNNNKFDPQGNATRAEASAILRRFVELVIDKGVMVDGK